MTTNKVVQAMRFIEAFLALMLGRRVPVVWGAGAPSMDDKGVVRLPRPKTGEAAEVALLTRLAVHEGGHLVHTQTGWADRLTAKECRFWNALEDPRMEREQTKAYPGATLVLSRGLGEMLKGVSTAADDRAHQDPEWAMQIDLLIRGLLVLAPHKPVLEHAPEVLGKLAAGITPHQREAIDATLPLLPRVQSSIEMEQVAKELVARLEQPPPPPEPNHDQPEQEDENEEDYADPSEGDSKAAGADDADGNDASQATAQQPGEGSGSDSKQQEGDSPTGGEQMASKSDEGEAPPDPQGGSDDAAAASGEPDSGGDQNAPGVSSGGQQASDSSNAQGAEPSPGQSTSPGAPDGVGATPSDNSTADTAEPSHKPNEGSQSTADAGSGEPGHGQPVSEEGESVDMGSLLRQVMVDRYGAGEEECAQSAPISEAEVEQLGNVLALADPAGSLDELVERALAAISEPAEVAGEPTDGAGLQLAAGESLSRRDDVDTRLQGVQSRLVTVLQRELQDKRRRPTRPAHAGGRIMTQRFWRLQHLGDTKVFAQRREVNGIEAAATVLIDSSDSMDEQLATAIQVGLAFSLALQRLGVRTKVVRFPGAASITETLQRFGESARACVDRCADLYASGGTPTGLATKIEMAELLQQRRLKNFMAVITDDGPGDPALLAEVLKCADAQDVQVVGVGIGCDIRMHIPTSVGINEVSELPDALSRLFRESISLKLAA